MEKAKVRLLLPLQFSDVLGKIVGDAQVLAEKANFSLDAAIQEHAPFAVSHRRTDIHLGGAEDSGHLALHLAALLELFYRSAQRNQIANVGGRTIAAPQNLLEGSRLARSNDQKLVDRRAELGGNSDVSGVDGLDLNGRGGKFLAFRFLGFWSGGFSLLQLPAGRCANVGTGGDELSALLFRLAFRQCQDGGMEPAAGIPI